MAWTSPNPQIYNTFGSLGTRHGDNYSINEECLCILEDVLRKLSLEDPSLRTFRRAIGFGQNIRKDLIPLLIYAKDDPRTTKIIDTTIRILVDLTIPVECLLSIESVSRTDVGRHTIFELNRLLATSKEAFTDGRSTKAIVDHMKHVLEKGSDLDQQQRESIDNCLLLLRNILHIPENNKTTARSNMQNEIIWNLFTQSIDKVIIYLMSHPQKMYWEVTLVQLIALMYKDQHVGTLQKLLNLWLEASLSETSEDNESNTSPQFLGSSDSSPTLTSDPTSDSSDNNDCNKIQNAIENRNKSGVHNRSKVLASMKRVKSTETDSSSGVSSFNQSTETDKSPHLSQTSSIDKEEDAGEKKQNSQSSLSEVSDCGYVTQVENQESISTSSNDDDQEHPIHQKPHTFQKSRYNGQKNRTATALEKKELRRKKLVKRSKANTILMKGLMHHVPTDEDVSNILKEFTVDFLLKGYGVLVYDLYSQLVTNAQLQMDTSHFFWLVTYFLKFATQLELDLEHISPVLSYEIISYLIFQGVWSCEELEISCKLPEADLKPCLRRLHLVVTAIKEFLQALEAYTKMSHVNEGDRRELLQLQKRISDTEDVRCLFLLLLRQYNPNVQSKQYLQDLIVTNHNYLLFLEGASRRDKTYATAITEHLQQFASVEIMKQYGLLLENFKQNGEFINNCVFTLMHHIAGDLEQVSTLFQPIILKAFSQIWETDYEICDDWSDLIEFVIHKFISTPRPPMSQDVNEKTACSDQVKFARNRVKLGKSKRGRRNRVFKVWYEFVCSSFYNSLSWTQEEKEKLLDFYNESRNSPNAITDITKRYESNGSKVKSQNSIIKELLEQNIINERQYNEFMKIRRPENGKSEPPDGNDETRKAATLIPESLINGDIKVIKEYLHREGKGKLIRWLQKVTIETCFVKLGLGNAVKRSKHVMEPTIYYYALLNLSVPLVPWTVDQQNILKYQPFILLLHKLGFHLPSDTGKIFVRIPNFWTAEYTFGIAQQLGPIDSTSLKFDVNSIIKAGTESLTEPDHLVTSSSGSSLDNELSITIPEVDAICCDLPPPELSIGKRCSLSSDLSSNSSDTDASPKQDRSHLNDNGEQNKNSVESDLTRMYVSDEEYRDA